MAVHRARVLELDGLRGVAVLLVAAAHVTSGTFPSYRTVANWIPIGGGGFIGVQVFFVLSGFLITTILLDEVEASGGSISLDRFYLRRAGRLLPALVLVCLGFMVYAWWSDVDHAAGDVFLSLTYTNNLGAVGRLIPESGQLGHTWSLAVEEQFYLVWPLVLLGAYRLRGRTGVAAVAVVGSLVTVALREVLDGAYAYESLRWDALLIGCWLAVVRPRVPVWVGAVGWGIIAAYAVAGGRALTSVDYLVSALGAAAVIATATSIPPLRSRFLRYFGSISYGLYLWHGLFGRFDVPALVAFGAAVGVAHVSFHLVERPALAVARAYADRRRDRVGSASKPREA